MLARAHALVASLALASVAHADPVDLPGTRASIDLDDGWVPIALSPEAVARGLVAGYRGTDGILAITRASVPNPAAWRPTTREAHADGIERGFASRLPGYARTRRRIVEVGDVPVLELEARTGDGRRVLARTLLMRTYALTVVIELAPGGRPARARAALATFSPGERTP